MSKWIGGLAEWVEGDTAFLSIAFTWKIAEAIEKAMMHAFQGRKVRAGGPALFQKKMQDLIAPYAELGGTVEDPLARHNPYATIASRGCPVGCSFCIVPAMEGREFTLIPDFPVRPVLCDNNLSALPIEYQKHIIERYQAEKVPLLDANSGFEPATFTEEVYRLWKPINQGPWRFAFDESSEREAVHRVMKMLKAEPGKKKRVYVLIGNEPFAECMARISEVIAAGCEPHVQPVIRLSSEERTPWVQFDWTEQKLRDVARWANGFVWRNTPFSEYDRSRKKKREMVYDEQQGLFL